MNQNQDVIKWWHTTRDFKTGLDLLSQTHRNKILIETLFHKSERFGRAKLEYELPKSVGLNYLDMPEFIQTEDEIPETNKAETMVDFIASNNVIPVPKKDSKEEYPPVILKITHQYSELYTQRSINHKKLSLNPNSTKENNDNRSAILQEIKKQSASMEFLHKFIEAFHKDNIIPNPNEVWPVEKVQAPNLETKTTLKKRRTNLIKLNYRDKNLLTHRTARKGKTQNPMPPSPKRTRIEQRMVQRTKEIKEIDYLLLYNDYDN